MSKRIWELDALRGLALLGMMGIHFVYDLVDLFGVWNWQQPAWYLFFKNNYGAVFFLISGISVTLGRCPVKRGAQVFLCGFLCTGVTLGMYLLGFAGKGIIIYMGVLQCLGLCMMLWPLFRRCPDWALVALGLAMMIAGWYLRTQSFPFWLLTPLGFAPYGFTSSDYFPLLPNLGYFLLGAVAGKRAYAGRKSLFPTETPPLGLFRWLGRHSLMVYLLHQPVLAAIVAAVAAWCVM